MLSILFLAFSTFALCALLIAISYFFAPRGKSTSGKLTDYECGLAPPPKSSSRTSVRFFLTAILFILFDIEIIFMYPFALAFRDFLAEDYGLPVTMAMGLFILLFLFGLWWEIKTNALNWK